MKNYCYKFTGESKDGFKSLEESLKDKSSFEIYAIDKDKKKISIKTNMSPDQLKKLIEEKGNGISLENPYKEYTLKAEIDCAACAQKVEDYLNKQEDIVQASFNYPTSTLKITTTLSKSRIKELAKEAEDGIEFKDDAKKYSFDVSIDCAECARKVEERLKNSDGISSAIFDFPKGKLIVETSLSEDEIKEICHEVEDDMEFIDKIRKYTFRASIDCAECAKKVENALLDNPNIKSAYFDFPKGKLIVETSLSEKEIKDICLAVEEDMEFLDAEKSSEKKDYTLYRIIISVAVFLISEISGIGYIAILSFLISGYDVLWKALKNIFKGKLFDENFLMAIATIGALAIASYTEAAAVMIFYQVGEYFQRRAVGKSRNSITGLMDITVDTCTKESDGKLIEEKCENIVPGDIIIIKAGEKIPLDGIVIEGSSYLDTKALTGESVPVSARKDSKVLSGSVNGDGRLRIKVTSYYSESTASKIVKLVEESENKKAKTEKFITKFSRYYTPFVCIAALLVAIIPPIFGLMTVKESIYRACVLLVISCPCALVLSVPLTYFASMGGFARNGVLVKGDEAIQAIARMQTLAMDKTGTLTEGVFKVQKVYAYNSSADYLMKVAASLEKNSSHPIATAILDKAGNNYKKAIDVEEIPGIGIEGYVDGKHIKVGSQRIMENAPELEDRGTHIYVTEDDTLLGIIVISDMIRSNSKTAIKELRRLGVKKIWMLSGDRNEIAQSTAKELGLDGAYGELLPDDKLAALEKLMNDGAVTGYAGDGINDAPTLKRADVGIAMGGVGSDAAIEASDAVIMNDDPEKIATAVSIAKKTENIVKENIIGSLSVKAIVFVLAIFGIANMWLGVIADTGVSLIAVINAMRALSWKKGKMQF